jgi:uncharacterized membrane protein YfcA
MQITWQMLLTVCPLVFLASFVDSVAGGGGLISLPAYYLAGLPPALAAGTNKLSASLGTLIASLRYIKARRVAWKIALAAILGAIPGSMAGAELIHIIPETTMRLIVICAIPLVAVIVLRRKDALTPKQVVPDKYILLMSLVTGLFIGFYDGLVGPGTGTFLILLFTLTLGQEAVMASGTAKLVNLASNIGALVTLLAQGQVLILLGLPAAACSMLGGYLGAGMTIKRGAGFIRWMLIGVLALLLARMLLDVIT